MMRNLLSLKNKTYVSFWAAFHVLIVLAFCISLFFSNGLNLNADLYEMLPFANNSQVSKIASSAVTENTGNSVFILSSHEEFAKAKNVAQIVYDSIKDSSKFKSLSFYSDIESVEDVQEFIQKWRFNLLDEKTVDRISQTNGVSDFVMETLSKVFGGFTFSSLDNLESDPFLLDDVNLQNYLKTISDSGTKLQPKDGVLATSFKNKWYVMIRGELSVEGAKLASKENAVPFIYEKCFPLEKDGVRFVFYGTPFHSYKSSTSASTEISIISTISLLAVIVIFFLIFKSFLPLISSALSIFISIGTAFCVTHLIFGNIHLITLVFGTSLIGSCIDYTVHYFINWKCSVELDSSDKIRKRLFSGLFLALISTELSFALLLFAPFAILKQMAVFSIVGMLSSFLTVMCLFTSYKFPPMQERKIFFLEKYSFKIPCKNVLNIVISCIILIASVSVLVVKNDTFQIKNNISNLYKMEGRLKEDTEIAYQVIDYSPTSWLIVSGNSIEEVLQKEESIVKRISDPLICTSKFIPSIKTQKESKAAVELLLPSAQELYDYYGFDKNSFDILKSHFEDSKNRFVTPEDSIPETLNGLLKTLWIGQQGEKYYSLILPAKVSDEQVYKDIANDTENVFFENKIADMSSGLDKLTELIIKLFLIAFIIIFVVMKFFYNWKETLKIISIPVLSILAILTIFVLVGLKIDFFCVVGCILVFGLGLDYVIYKIENKENKIEDFAIILSFVTTAISFGALALSSFMPVHIIGLSIFTGLFTAFICSML